MYRDEREALRRRAEAATEAQREAVERLAEAHAELGSHRERELARQERLDALQAEVERLRGEEGAPISPPRPKQRKPLSVWGRALWVGLVGTVASSLAAPLTHGDPWFGLVAEVACPLLGVGQTGPFHHGPASLYCQYGQGELGVALGPSLSDAVTVGSAALLWALIATLGAWLVNRLWPRRLVTREPSRGGGGE